ncbi:GIP [Symbiodinium sp. CCMP2592]|nr:GIP [Symbiodinium sp. CCMP2592]
MYVEDPVEGLPAGSNEPEPVHLCKVCASDDPGVELGGLTRASNLLVEEEGNAGLRCDLEENVEYWASRGLYDIPKLNKLEPEYVTGIEDIITHAVETKTPLRHTYNVSFKEAKAVITKWQPSIVKELGVVERGFKRITTRDVAKLKETTTVQELPSKLVYTVKPPAGDLAASAVSEADEAAYCKRKARIVCCGNYADADQEELFAGGAAAESLRCALTYTAHRQWRSGITDVTGAFMLTPLPTGPGQVVYIIRPPAALIQLGLATEDERWQLTHGMYGLRQSPKLWAAFRDGEITKMTISHLEKRWTMKKGVAEPNLWLLYEVDGPTDQEPAGLILLYVDDILLCGPLWLVQAVSSSIRGVWKASELDLLDVDHEIRFLGCEIAVSEDYSAIYIHQRPYIEEILRQYATPETEQSPIQAPKELVTFEAYDGESAGTEDEIKRAQKACGELLWIAQRSRPDISYVVCAMGSLLTRAAPRCLEIARRLRSYLQRTKNLALALRPVREGFSVYTDSSFAPEGAKSHSGLVAVWLGAPICWRSARQPFVCLSTAECELLAATEGLIMGKSIVSVINEMFETNHITVHVDNQAAVTIAKPTSSASWRTRHLRVRASYIHEQVELGQVSVEYVQGKHQWAEKAMVKMMVMCMMIQTSRAQEEEPLALTASLDIYVMVIILGIAVVAAWEFLWWCVDHCCGEVRPSRGARRLRNLQETIQREIELQMAERQVPPTPLPETPLASPTSDLDGD